LAWIITPLVFHLHVEQQFAAPLSTISKKSRRIRTSTAAERKKKTPASESLFKHICNFSRSHFAVIVVIQIAVPRSAHCSGK